MSKKVIYLDDAIDAVGSMLRRKFGIGSDLAEITLAGLPPAQPEREKSEWIEEDYVTKIKIRCKKCGEYARGVYRSKFCPNCGRYMWGKNNGKTT